MNEIWRYDYQSENTSNDIFHFSVKIIGSFISQYAFSRAIFSLDLSVNRLKHSFRRLYPRKFRGFYKRMENVIWYFMHIYIYINKCTNTFYVFTIKIEIRNKSESREFRCENDLKSAYKVHFFIFSSRNHYL